MPLVYCVMPDPMVPGRTIALFAYQSSVATPDNQPFYFPYDANDNSLSIDTVDQGALSGVPSYFLPGLHVNAFSVSFVPGQQVI